MEDLGAAETVVRRYRPAGDLTGGTGGHLVSRFVDDRSASQTVQVLQSWHDRCMERLARFETKRVSRMTSVKTSRGTASWYLVTHAEADADQGRFDALGVLRDGSTVELLHAQPRGAGLQLRAGQGAHGPGPQERRGPARGSRARPRAAGRGRPRSA